MPPSPALQVVRPAAADRTPALRLADLRDDGRLYRILLEHAFLGIRVQLLLRLAPAAFVVAVVFAVPPEHERVACEVVAGVYVCWVIAVTWFALRGGERVVRLIWLALFADVLVLVVLCVLASRSERTTRSSTACACASPIATPKDVDCRPSISAPQSTL